MTTESLLIDNESKIRSEIRKTTVTFPEVVLDALQLFTATNKGFNFRDQSKIVVTALVEFLLTRGIEVDLEDPMVRKFVISSELRKLRKTERSED